MTPQEKAADSRLWNTYGIRLVDYDRILEEQSGCCAICGEPPVNIRLSVEHDHRWDRVPVKVTKLPNKSRVATATDPYGVIAEVVGLTAAGVRKEIKKILRRRSIRGLACARCNKGLSYYRRWVEGFFTEVPELYESAANYIRRFNQSKLPTVPHENQEPSNYAVVFTNLSGDILGSNGISGPGA